MTFFRFEDPWLLLILFLLPALIWQERRTVVAIHYSSLAALKTVSPHRSEIMAMIPTVLRFIAIALFIMPLINIGLYENRNINRTIIKDDENYTNRIDSLEINLLPDIYYIVPDAHTNSKILSEVFNYDNSGFVNDMIERGFYVKNYFI